MDIEAIKADLAKAESRDTLVQPERYWSHVSALVSELARVNSVNAALVDALTAICDAWDGRQGNVTEAHRQGRAVLKLAGE